MSDNKPIRPITKMAAKTLSKFLYLACWVINQVIPEEVPNPGEIVFEANRFYQRPNEASVPVLQLTYTDKNGRYPWDEGCLRPELQPRPGTWRA